MTLLEKFNPKSWDDLILPNSVKESLMKIQTKKGYRLLLYSTPGTGKTTTLRIMTLHDNLMYLSGSNDFNIEVLRNKVMRFATSGQSVTGDMKTVAIDEFENIRDNIQDAFKIILDQCKNVNFIFCTNEVEKINPAIKSRCTNFDYDFVNTNLVEHKRNYAQWVLNICKWVQNEYNITFDNGALKLLIKNNFPDFRHVLIILQQVIDSGQNITVDSVNNCSENSKQLVELYEIIENIRLNPDVLYQELTKYKGSEKDVLMSLGEPFFKYLNDKEEYQKTLEAAQIVSKYCDSYIVSINKFVTLLSCIMELRSIFR